MKSFLQAFALAVSLSFVAVLASVTTAVAQEGSGERAVIEIVHILHRDPTRVRQTVRPALDPRGSIGQIDDKLIIATTATNLQQLRTMIADVDVPPRRLIIGVDFAYQPDTTDNSSQQESQAIEGQELVFIATIDEPDSDAAVTGTTAAGPDIGNTPRMTIAAEILNDSAAVNLSLENVAGLSGSHLARVPLGVWQRIDTPVPDPGTETSFDPDTGPETQPDIPAIAVRVDRVP